MPKSISQKITFKNATAADLYDLYMNSKKHSQVTGAPTKIPNKEGAVFNAHGDYITGKNLKLVKDSLIVQSWRGSDWKKTDEDSIFMIALEQSGNDVVLHMNHFNIPDKEADGIKSGWNDYYWKPWKEYLKRQ
jgi:activator of HSP90 ATPase